MNQILSVEESPLAVAPAPAPGLLTPPPSSRKSISDHSVTLAGGLTQVYSVVAYCIEYNEGHIGTENARCWGFWTYHFACIIILHSNNVVYLLTSQLMYVCMSVQVGTFLLCVCVCVLPSDCRDLWLAPETSEVLEFLRRSEFSVWNKTESAKSF